MTITIVPAAAVWVAAWLGIAALARSSAGARLGLLLAAALLPVPWLVRAPYQQRVILAFALGFLFISAVDFATGRRPPTFLRRVAYIAGVIALVDTLSATATRRRFDGDAALRVAAAVGCGLAAIAVWLAVEPLGDAIRVPLRLLAAAAAILSVAELTAALVQVVSAAFGVRFDAVHDRPYRSRTLTDFWSRRWNRFGARWFRQHVFVPLRPASLTLALFALFGVSAAMHVYLIAAVVDVRLMVLCAAFFLFQPPLLLVERRLRVNAWPAVASRAWTISILTLLLPLVLAPLLSALRVSF